MNIRLTMATCIGDMHYYHLFFVWFITALLVHFLIKAFLKPNTTINTTPPPPSPPALPIIGHLHLVGSVLPLSFHSLARKYGPLIQIRMGAASCIVASNATVAKEILKTQELNFCSRPDFSDPKYFIYGDSRFVFSEYNDYWRFMKKLCMTQLLAVPQLDKFYHVRDEEKVKLVESVMQCCKEGKLCDLRSALTTMTNNIFCRMALSTRSSGSENEAQEIQRVVKTCLHLAGKLSVGDVLGPFKVLDFSGNGIKFVAALKKFDNLIERIIKEHQEKVLKGFEKDLMDILLETYNDPTAEVRLTMTDIKSFMLDLFMAGTDTSSGALQWAMAELISNPKVYKKLREEITSVVGTNRLVAESDIQNLPYLQAVIKETLRLHPSAPLIIRECGEDCIVNDSLIKAKTRVIVNVYAVMRDPESWSNPEKFIPERFLEGSDDKIGEHQMEFKGQNFRYLPFGSGRRGCPGASLAMRVMPLALGALVQCFDWKSKDGDQKFDLSLGPGFGAEMAHPLVCNPVPHLYPL